MVNLSGFVYKGWNLALYVKAGASNIYLTFVLDERLYHVICFEGKEMSRAYLMPRDKDQMSPKVSAYCFKYTMFRIS